MQRSKVLADIERAISLRLKWFSEGVDDVCHHSHRLFDRSGDGCADLVIDRYGDYIRVEYYDPNLAGMNSDICQLISHRVNPQGIVSILRQKKGRIKVIHDTVHEVEVQIRERNRRVNVRLGDAGAGGVGIFFDQRLTRDRIEYLAPGQKVLNLFAHAGATGVAAICGGAAHIDHVDAARKTATWAAHNYALNGGDPKAHRFIIDDAFKFLKRLIRQERRYDIIFCDPPVFSRGASQARGDNMQASTQLLTLAEACAQLLSPGGFLCFACNSRRLNHTSLFDTVEHAFHKYQIQFDIVKMPLGRDFMSQNDEQIVSTKGIWLTRR